MRRGRDKIGPYSGSDIRPAAQICTGKATSMPRVYCLGRTGNWEARSNQRTPCTSCSTLAKWEKDPSSEQSVSQSVGSSAFRLFPRQLGAGLAKKSLCAGKWHVQRNAAAAGSPLSLSSFPRSSLLLPISCCHRREGGRKERKECLRCSSLLVRNTITL